MNTLLVAPMGLLLIGVVAGSFLPRLLPPSMCARVLTAALVTATGGAAAALVLVVAAAAAGVHPLLDAIGWCGGLSHGHGVNPWAGLVALGLLGIAAGRGLRYRHRVRAEHAAFADIHGIEIVPTTEPIAFAVPGRPGGVVVGSALMLHLDRHERAAVLAHENAHLRHHHHRYVHTAEMCAAAFPFLVPLARRVRFATERWADETAASEIGSRTVVAKAIARVALMPATRQTTAALAFSGRGATARVDALLNPNRDRRLHLPIAASLVALSAVLSGTSVQLHHLVTFLAHCPT